MGADSMTKEEIEQRLAHAGWEIDDGFSGYLIIGCRVDPLSIVATKQAYDTDNPTFELLDHIEDLVYWVSQIPTPRQAARLLGEHGKPLQATAE